MCLHGFNEQEIGKTKKATWCRANKWNVLPFANRARASAGFTFRAEVQSTSALTSHPRTGQTLRSHFPGDTASHNTFSLQGRGLVSRELLAVLSVQCLLTLSPFLTDAPSLLPTGH